MVEAVWRHKDGLGDAELDGERVVWDPQTGGLARLDQVGSLVWGCFEAPATVDDVAADLAAAFEASPDRVRSDVAALVERLRDLGLLVEVPPAGP
ncbi:MAG TPA: PqqD family peptide modification chaperone [Acidimicrobiales bacterium]|nr:PqqD family peptide modification chaperone [Acidimicrobiales bacterium]